MKYYGFKSIAKFPRSNLKNLGFANGMAQVIKSLFANNEQGFAFDFNDLSTMFQDSAGTIPVTGVGQPVGKVLDKSGRGNHATQSTSAKRPILQQNATTGAYYLAFDGVDDFLVTGNVDFSATSDMSLILGQDKLRNPVNYEFVMGTDGNIGQDGYLRIMNTNINSSPVTQVDFRPQTAGKGINQVSSAPIKQVLIANFNLSNKTFVLSINKNKVSSDTGSATGKFGLKPIGLGASPNGAWYTQCNMYSAIAISRVMTPTEITNTENAIAKNVGVTL